MRTTVKIPIFLLLIAAFTTISSSIEKTKFKAFRSLKTPKINKQKLSLIIQRLKADNTTRVETLEKCPKFTFFTFCNCEPTCADMEPLCEGCKPGCSCRNGFVRNTKTSECILPEDCPRKIRRFELQPPRRIYEAVPILATLKTTKFPMIATTEIMSTTPSTTTEMITEEQQTSTSFSWFEEPRTAPLLILRSGPTPPSAPPVLNMAIASDNQMIGAPSATPPPDFVYGPPGMNAAKYVLYDNYMKQKRIMKALRQRRNRLMKKL